jgi:hypothetical protein
MGFDPVYADGIIIVVSIREPKIAKLCYITVALSSYANIGDSYGRLHSPTD